jgi:hypothetical protein
MKKLTKDISQEVFDLYVTMHTINLIEDNLSKLSLFAVGTLCASLHSKFYDTQLHWFYDKTR